MKKVLLLIAFLLTAGAIVAQKTDPSQVPDIVKKSYKLKISDTVAPHWVKDGEFYTAAFNKGELKAEIRIRDNGEWSYTRWELNYSKYVPQKIRENVTASYPGFKVQRAVIEFNPGGEYYVITVKKKKEVQHLNYNMKYDFVKAEKETAPDK